MMPASAASSAPLSEDSSQGCATAVVSGCRFFVAAISRSYFSADEAEMTMAFLVIALVLPRVARNDA